MGKRTQLLVNLNVSLVPGKAGAPAQGSEQLLIDLWRLVGTETIGALSRGRPVPAVGQFQAMAVDRGVVSCACVAERVLEAMRPGVKELSMTQGRWLLSV